ncbi:type I DNA topoisomerase [Acidipropionibacterium timonense]|uniref:type I DNA topoisomerase n=1 Tax=Acidipropionibacterium timonense TaxID=2161818 RepID=UPI001031C986|nr:type I DNA topoisomerase [Acidipropionibacterium timonense]
MAPTKSLVIVESPHKATMIAGYLGPKYVVRASQGHVRDLPTSASQVPAKYKGEPWARTGVDVDHEFKPIYVVPSDKKATIRELKGLLKDADELYLATDGDREGEAIAWHLLDELKPKVPVKRMVFNEITEKAITDAVRNTRDLDTDLVDAQETRRILDRLYGYEVSPVLWKKVMPRLSAGRVQSVATRLVVDRERERMAFVSANFWDLEATLTPGEKAEEFTARLVSLDGTRVATGRDYDSHGVLRARTPLRCLDEATATTLARGLESASFRVAQVEAKPYTRRPYAPFRTTTLQQEAGRKLGFTAQRTMSVAQELYEGGFITYMRTDSVALSQEAIDAARTQAIELYGRDHVPAKPRVYTSKVKNAQEAHEAIRPAGYHFRTPAQTGLTGDRFKLYELVWMRTLASQMADAKGETLTLTIDAEPASPLAVPGSDAVSSATFTASGRTITFHGFLRAYVESVDEGASDDAQKRLPQVSTGQGLDCHGVEASGHDTRPPARYTEPSLVAKLEELEIGRPSTYASIIRTITGRDYVFKKGQALVPTWLAFAVTRLLEEHFARLVDYQFTADMEGTLDEIARGDANRVAVLSQFYFGGSQDASPSPTDGHEGLHQLVTELGDIDARAMSTFPVGGDDSGIVVRVGRYGTYVEGPDEARANVPEDLPPDELTVERATELLATPNGQERELGLDPTSHLPIVARTGRFGPYVTEVLDEDTPKSGKGKVKARTASLLRSMSLETVSLDDALKLLALPRVVGTDDDGAQITAQNGRYGPYLKKGTDSRSLASEEQIFTITLEEAKALYAQPKQRGRAAAKPPLKELGEDPTSGRPIVVKDGRFGPYVTDGQTNATLRRDDSVEAITPERAQELLAEKRARGTGTTRTTSRRKSSTTSTKGTRATSTAKTTSTKASASKARTASRSSTGTKR